MAMERTAAAIALRFGDERDSIERYVRFLRSKTAIHDRQVHDLNQILHRVKVQPLPTRHYDRASEPYSSEEIATLVAALNPIGKEVYQTILGHEQRLDDIPSNVMDGPAAEYAYMLDEWVDFLMREMHDDPNENHVDELLKYAYSEAERLDDEILPLDAIQPLIEAAMEHALHIKTRQRIDAMEFAITLA